MGCFAMDFNFIKPEPTPWTWKQAWPNLLAPPVCVACETILPSGETTLFCRLCLSFINSTGWRKVCLGCGARFPGELTVIQDCAYCQSWPRRFTSVTSLSNYEGLVQDLVIRMKNRNGEITSLQMGKLLAQHLSKNATEGLIKQIDWVTPIPTHWHRRLRRGFNVSELLVESVCQVPVWRGKSKKLLATQRKTGKQGTLSISQRFQNVKKCFKISGKTDLQGATILLIDDVMTSGATALQALQLLKNAGANAVHLGIIARGIGRQTAKVRIRKDVSEGANVAG